MQRQSSVMSSLQMKKTAFWRGHILSFFSLSFSLSLSLSSIHTAGAQSSGMDLAACSRPKGPESWERESRNFFRLLLDLPGWTARLTVIDSS